MLGSLGGGSRPRPSGIAPARRHRSVPARGRTHRSAHCGWGFGCKASGVTTMGGGRMAPWSWCSPWRGLLPLAPSWRSRRTAPGGPPSFCSSGSSRRRSLSCTSSRAWFATPSTSDLPPGSVVTGWVGAGSKTSYISTLRAVLLIEPELFGHTRTDNCHVVFSVESFDALVIALGSELIDLINVAIETDTRCQ